MTRTQPHDPVNHPSHYTHGREECIHFARHMGFDQGNAFKYLYRMDHKGNAMQDLQKAEWYIRDAITKPGRINYLPPGHLETIKRRAAPSDKPSPPRPMFYVPRPEYFRALDEIARLQAELEAQ